MASMENVAYEYSYNFRIFTRFGLWKGSFKKPWMAPVFILYRIFIWVDLTLFLSLMYIDLYVIRHDIEKLNYNLCLTVTMSVVYLKTLIMMKNQERIENLRDSLNNNYYLPRVGTTDEEWNILRNSSKHSVLIAKLLYGVAGTTVIFWWLIPLFDTKDPGRLPFRTWVPDDMLKTPYYQCVYLFHVFTSVYIVVNTVAVDVIYYAFLIQASGQYGVLERNILYCNSRQSFIDAIIHHQEIIKSISEIESLYNIPVLLQMIAGIMLLEVDFFDIVMNSREFSIQLVTQFFYVACAFIDLYFYCIYGTILEEKSYSIVDAVYACPWYKLECKQRKDFGFIIMRAQNAPVVTVGKLCPVRLHTFLTILKLSYNFLAVMWEVAKR